MSRYSAMNKVMSYRLSLVAMASAQRVHDAQPYLLLGCMYVLNLLLFWPGQMSPDSYAQYTAAVTGVYGDHHPPMMSVVWRLLDHWYKGSGLLCSAHLLMLYGAAAVFIKTFSAHRVKWLYVVLPLIPPISFYSSMLWKDVGFAFSYVCALSLISYYCMNTKRPSTVGIALILTLLFYGTAVKFQAQYVLPIALFGLSYCMHDFAVTRKTVISAFSLSVLCFVGLYFFNYAYVTPQGKGHTWQLVKLYDLAGISFYSGKPVFPDFILTSKQFSMAGVKKHFNHERVDDLTGFEDSPLRMGNSEIERQELLNCWYSAIMHHPYFYLKHRFGNWLNIINSVPIKRLDTLDFSGYKGLRWFCSIQKYARMSAQEVQHTKDYFLVKISKMLMHALALMRSVLCISVLLPFMLFYFLFGLVRLRTSNAAMPLIIMNGLSIALLLVLFFFCMASTIRYAYIVICMVHASHGFAYICLKDWWAARAIRG